MLNLLALLMDGSLLCPHLPPEVGHQIGVLSLTRAFFQSHIPYPRAQLFKFLLMITHRLPVKSIFRRTCVPTPSKNGHPYPHPGAHIKIHVPGTPGGRDGQRNEPSITVGVNWEVWGRNENYFRKSENVTFPPYKAVTLCKISEKYNGYIFALQTP